MVALPPRFLEKLDTIIDENLSNEDFSIEALCSQMNVSYHSVYRKIKEQTGLTPSRYVCAKRLQRAIYLLDNSEFSIQQIAYKVGFSTQAYFTRCFVNEMGCPPTQYRKELEGC